MQQGHFITIEGGEGVGKSTAVTFIHEVLTQANIKNITTREPGGTRIAEAIRQVLLAQYEEQMHADTELLLLFASRCQHVAQVIKPALTRGDWVVCDRFVDASFAYQGAGRGIPFPHIDQLVEWSLGEFTPDITILLDAPAEVGLQRLLVRGKKDRIEQEDINFFTSVRNGYLALAATFSERYRVINADQPLSLVHDQLLSILTPIIHQYQHHEQH